MASPGWGCHEAFWWRWQEGRVEISLGVSEVSLKGSKRQPGNSANVSVILKPKPLQPVIAPGVWTPNPAFVPLARSPRLSSTAKTLAQQLFHFPSLIISLLLSAGISSPA